MDKRIKLKIKMELLSDTILGSGYSIPGEEDIAVCHDENGYPYMKGSSFKGILKESMENLALWQQLDKSGIEEMLGVEDWNGNAEERRIHVTSLRLVDRPEDPEECYTRRTFTSLENGVIKKGTLRTAACIIRGSVFTGELNCAEGDAAFIRQALAGIKWVGTLRNRGFGRVKITGEIENTKKAIAEIEEAACLHYHLETELPVVITDPGRSKGYHYETAGYIPGSAIRGAVIGYLAAKNPLWFEAHKKEVLREIYFLDAMPDHDDYVVLPSLKGFYEKKDGSDFQSVLRDGELSPGVKRAGMGGFCTIEGNRILYWSAETAGITRIKTGSEEEKLMFQSRYLCEGQSFDGYILLKTPELAEYITKVLENEIWIGADRFEGFGKCRITLEKSEQPKWREKYGYGEKKQTEKTFYMLAVSPFTMLDEQGKPCGIEERRLAELLGVDTATVAFCSTAVREFHTYNRTLGCNTPSVCMYDRGSVFKLECSAAPDREKLLKLQAEGLGIRKAEGFGQILFMPRSLYESISGKKAWEKPQVEKPIASVRRAKYRWIMEQEQNGTFRGGLSNSQIGEIQGYLEKALENGGDTGELEKHFIKNRQNRGVKHGERFEDMVQFIESVFGTSMGELLGISDMHLSEAQEKQEKLKLLCMLFDYSRKGKER